MKRVYQIILVVFFVQLSACSDEFLELEPKVNRLESNAYITENDAFEAMVAVYHAFAVQPWVHVPMMSDMFSDDSFTGGEPGGGMIQYQELENSTATPDNGAAMDLWNKLYSGIYRANVYLEKEASIEWKTEGLRERIKAEVSVLRAHFYWDLVRHYGWVPLITERFETFEDSKEVPQSTPDEVLTFIAKELIDAIPALPLVVGPDQKGRITKDMARMLIARIYLLHDGFLQPVLGAASWTDGRGLSIDQIYVRDMVDEILESGRYSLIPDYADVFDWNNQNNEESIFEWQYSATAASSDWSGWGVRGNFAVVFYGPRNPQGDPEISEGWSFGTMSWTLYDEFEDGDPRRDVTIYNADERLTGYTRGHHNTGFFNGKYMPRSAYLAAQGIDAHNWSVNYKDMRLAELYLIGAELNLNSNPTRAAEYLNMVRVRSMGNSAAKSSITLDDVYHERRVELAGEGHRKWDLLRRGLDYTKIMLDASYDVPSGIENEEEFSQGVFLIDTWGMLPIPAAEIRLVNEGNLRQYIPAYGG